jgi:hypothetical protein
VNSFREVNSTVMLVGRIGTVAVVCYFLLCWLFENLRLLVLHFETFMQ